jgi:hypothetical protein
VTIPNGAITAEVLAVLEALPWGFHNARKRALFPVLQNPMPHLDGACGRNINVIETSLP